MYSIKLRPVLLASLLLLFGCRKGPELLDPVIFNYKLLAKHSDDSIVSVETNSLQRYEDGYYLLYKVRGDKTLYQGILTCGEEETMTLRGIQYEGREWERRYDKPFTLEKGWCDRAEQYASQNESDPQ